MTRRVSYLGGNCLHVEGGPRMPAHDTREQNMSQEFHKFWLKITALVIAGFAPVLFLGTMEATSGPARLTIDMLSWPVDGVQTYDAPETRFLSALLGGFLLGWGVMVWCLSVWVHDLAPEPVRRSVVIGIVCWFLLDSAGSIASGTASNALFNVVILLVAVGPLWRPATSTTSTPS
ncbi:hypothetical protein [Minwuia sp.]|uniref:hypothetical protein n=1 Tax=Minwuia sp. TaxID=2493630 RepID=UPI003A91B4F7